MTNELVLNLRYLGSIPGAGFIEYGFWITEKAASSSNDRGMPFSTETISNFKQHPTAKSRKIFKGHRIVSPKGSGIESPVYLNNKNRYLQQVSIIMEKQYGFSR